MRETDTSTSDPCPTCLGAPIRISGGRVAWCCPACVGPADVDDPLADLPDGLVKLAAIPAHALPPESARTGLVGTLTAELIRLRSQVQSLEAQRRELTDMVQRTLGVSARWEGMHQRSERRNLTLRSQLDQAEARRLDRADPAVRRLIDVAALLIAENRERMRRRGLAPNPACTCRLCELQAALAAL